MNKIVKYTLLYLAGILILLPFWIFSTFGGSVTVEQIMFHVLSGLEAVEGTDHTLKLSFILHNLAAPLLFPLVAAIISFLVGMFAKRRETAIDKLITITCVLLLAAGSGLFIHKLHIVQYVRSRFGRDIFSGLYADPAKEHIKAPVRKKNLVLIYVESLESDLADLRPDHTDAIQALNNLPGRQVMNFFQSPGTGWSIAGMISSQTGVPLKPFYFNDAGDFMGKFAHKGFFPNLVSLSDILAKNGYVQYFLTAPDIKFADTDKFFLGHHYNYAIGREEWLKRGLEKDLFTSWGEGLQDDTLLDEAYKIISEQRARKQPFVLAMITTDTHFPDGFPSPKCNPVDAHSSFIGAFRYTSVYLAGIIDKLIADGALADTDIIIMGDHLFMASDEQISKYFAKDRRVYFKMITAENRKPNRDSMTHFDVAPTILDLLGMRKNPDEHFGLGISLFSKISPADYDRHLQQVLSPEILSASVVYDSFWSSGDETTRKAQFLKAGGP
jgi:phosphoglycerol transferase